MLMIRSEKKVTIILHGYLKKYYDKPFEVIASTAAEAINGFCKMTKALDPDPIKGRHTIRVKGYETKGLLFAPLNTDTKELHIFPELCGGKNGGFARIVVGTILVGVALAAPALAVGGVAITGATGLLFNFGLSLVLGGLLELISPAPKIDRGGDTASDPEASKYLGATQNTVKIGTRIPLLYGRHRVGGHYLSFDVDAKDVDI